MMREGVIRTVWAGGWFGGGMKGRDNSSPVMSSTSVEVTQVDVLNGGGILVEKCNNLIGQQESDGL